MAATAALIDRVCDRVGTDKTSPAHFTRAMVSDWLGEAQRILCAEGPILRTCFKGSSKANVEITSLPTPDFFKITRIDIRRAVGAPGSGQVNKRIRPMGHITERPTDRSTVASDTPSKYAVWAGNDASGNSAKGILWDKNFGTDGTDDLYIYLRQMPKTPADGGQAPEVAEVWQDAMVDYAEMRARLRMSAMDPQQLTIAKSCSEQWEIAKQRARDQVDPEFDDEPVVVQDVAGYTVDDEDTTF